MAQALLVAHPMVVISNFFVGAGVLGKAIVYSPIPDVLAQGLLSLGSPLTVSLLLLAAWGVAHNARGIGALLLQLLVLLLLSVPFLRALGTGAPPLLMATTAASTVVLVVLIARTSKDRTGRRRWWWLPGFAAGVALVAGIGATSQSLPFNPTAALSTSGSGAAGTGADLPAPRPPQNPALAPDPFNSIHHDAWATDAYALPSPGDPRGAPVESLFTGGDCATITFDSRGRLITLCSTLTRVVAYVVDPDTLEVLDRRVVGQRTPSVTDFSGGGYFILDARDRIVFVARGGVLRILETTEGLPDAGQVDVSGTLQPGEQVTSVLPDWRGRYWYVGAFGTVGIVRDGVPEALNLGGEDIENSFAISREAAYVVTGAALYRLEAGDAGAPTVAWRTEYDRGTRQKPGQTSRASGTTPTILGRWVAITDNAEPRMNILVVERNTGTVTCTVPVFADGRSATDNSLIALDDTLVVENNYGYKPAITSTSAGRTTEPGLAAIRVTAQGCTTAWSNDKIHIPSVVSKATSIGGLIITYTKPPNLLGVDSWYFTAVDIRTGEVTWTRRAGAGTPFNNHYAAAYLRADGDMFVGTTNGFAVLRAGP